MKLRETGLGWAVRVSYADIGIYTGTGAVRYAKKLGAGKHGDRLRPVRSLP